MQNDSNESEVTPIEHAVTILTSPRAKKALRLIVKDIDPDQKFRLITDEILELAKQGALNPRLVGSIIEATFAVHSEDCRKFLHHLQVFVKSMRGEHPDDPFNPGRFPQKVEVLQGYLIGILAGVVWMDRICDDHGSSFEEKVTDVIVEIFYDLARSEPTPCDKRALGDFTNNLNAYLAGYYRQPVSVRVERRRRIPLLAEKLDQKDYPRNDLALNEVAKKFGSAIAHALLNRLVFDEQISMMNSTFESLGL